MNEHKLAIDLIKQMQGNVKLAPTVKSFFSSFNFELSLSNHLSEAIQYLFSTPEAFITISLNQFNEYVNAVGYLFTFINNLDKMKIIKAAMPVLISYVNNLIRGINKEKQSNELIRNISLIQILLQNHENDDEVFKNELSDIIIKCLCICDNKLRNMVLNDLMRDYIKNTNHSNLFYEIWINCKNVGNLDHYFKTILFILQNYSFRADVIKIVTKENSYWIILEECLKYENEVSIRKYCSFIIRQSINILNINNKHNLQCIIWNKENDNIKWWNMYLNAIENISERQTHLALPTLRLMNDVLNNDISNDHISWISILIVGGFSHESDQVIKQTILQFFELDPIKFRNSFTYVNSKLLDALCEYSLYSSFIGSDFEDRYVKWLNALDNEFVEIFMKNVINKLTWAPVPLYYLLNSLLKANNDVKPFWSYESLEMIINFVNYGIINHDTKIRREIQNMLIKLLDKYLKRDEENVENLFRVLMCLKRDNCIEYLSENWKISLNFTRFSRSIVNQMLIEKFREFDNETNITSEYSTTSLAQIIFFLQDSTNIFETNTQLNEWITNIFKSFESSNVYHIQDNRLNLIRCILNEIKDVKIESKNILIKLIKLKLKNYSKNIILYVITKMLQHNRHIDLYANCLNDITGHHFFDYDIITSNDLENWLNISYNNIKNTNSILEKYSVLKLINSLFLIISKRKWIPMNKLNMKIIQIIKWLMDNGELNNNCDKIIKYDNETFEEKKQYKVLISNCVECSWSILIASKMIAISYNLEDGVTDEIFDISLEALDIIRNEGLFYILSVIKLQLLSKSNRTNHVKILKKSWNVINECGRLKDCITSIECWFNIAFKLYVEDEECRNFSITCFTELMNHEKPSPVHCIPMLEALFKLSNNSDISNDEAISRLLTISLIYGTTLRKHQKIEQDVIRHIQRTTMDEMNEINDFEAEHAIRVIALKILLTAKYAKRVIFVENVTKELLRRNTNDNKKGYYIDSNVHRMKHRTLQVLLICEHCLYSMQQLKSEDSEKNKREDVINELWNWSMDNLLKGINQTSVKFQLEWLIIRLLLHYPNLFIIHFYNSIDRTSTNTVGICSLISIAYHVAKQFNDEINQIITKLIPWTCAQNFNVRLYSQVVLWKLLCDIKKGKGIIDNNNYYDVLQQSLSISLNEKNAKRNSQRVMRDFYFASFHPINHFSIQIIFTQIGRLCNISSEESFEMSLIERIWPANTVVPLSTKDDINLCNYPASSCVTREPVSDLPSTVIATSSLTLDLQRKFIPCENNSQSNENKLIIVASLLEKATNLGGLTRTSEIFNVSELVFDSLNILNNKEFTALSTGAEKHLRLIQVKRHELCNYLNEMKRQRGFTLIAVEQTNNSLKLNETKLPEKTLLLLGYVGE